MSFLLKNIHLLIFSIIISFHSILYSEDIRSVIDEDEKSTQAHEKILLECWKKEKIRDEDYLIELAQRLKHKYPKSDLSSEEDFNFILSDIDSKCKMYDIRAFQLQDTSSTCQQIAVAIASPDPRSAVCIWPFRWERNVEEQAELFKEHIDSDWTNLTHEALDVVSLSIQKHISDSKDLSKDSKMSFPALEIYDVNLETRSSDLVYSTTLLDSSFDTKILEIKTYDELIKEIDVISQKVNIQ